MLKIYCSLKGEKIFFTLMFIDNLKKKTHLEKYNPIILVPRDYFQMHIEATCRKKKK